MKISVPSREENFYHVLNPDSSQVARLTPVDGIILLKFIPTVKWGEPGQLEPGHKQRKKMSSGSSSSDICLKPPDGRKFHSGFLFQAMEVHVNVVLFAP